jgi:RimJ/RimL family protein N-acetyltransferase
LSLRPARTDDARFLLRMRNDPLTRRWSFDTQEIPWDTHLAWLGKRLALPRPHLYVVEADGQDAGSCRLDVVAGLASVSIVIAPALRRRGLAPLALAALVNEASTDPNIHEIVAYVREANEGSLTAFRRAGFVDTGLCAADADGAGRPPQPCLRLACPARPRAAP